MTIQIPRKNSRQWKTAITLIDIINSQAGKWIDDVGFGHAELIDDVSRLRKKGWIVEDKENIDLFSRSYRLDQDFWNSVKDTIKPFWE